MTLKKLKSLTILYVEDEKFIRQNAVEYLSRYCHRVLEASNAEDGYAIYKKEAPDIIISDIKMKKLSGLAFASKIRIDDKKTPIIITTAYTDTEYLLKAVELQLVKYIVKPINFDKLQEALFMACETLEEKEELNRIYLDKDTQYDIVNQTLFQKQKLVNLTHNELLFFDFLVKNRQRTITYSEIESIIWAYEGISMDALRSLVRGLRKKLNANYIENISGIGYSLTI